MVPQQICFFSIRYLDGKSMYTNKSTVTELFKYKLYMDDPSMYGLLQFQNISSIFFRWVKYEENLEEGGKRWSKPHVASLSMHSLFELRCAFVDGVVTLDHDAHSLANVAGNFTIKLGPLSTHFHKNNVYHITLLK